MGAHADSDVRVVLDALRRIVSALRLSARAAEGQHGISGAQLFVLHLLDGAELSINELAARTFTHQSSVSVVVQRLAAAGYVARRAGNTDARRTHVRLTAAGRALLRRAPEPVQTQLIMALRQLRSGDRRRLAEIL